MSNKTYTHDEMIEIFKKVHRYIIDNNQIKADLILNLACKDAGVTYKWYCDNFMVWSDYDSQEINKYCLQRI